MTMTGLLFGSRHPTPNSQFPIPSVLNAYCHKLSRSFYLGQKAGHPIYATSIQLGYSGPAGVTLFSGPSNKNMVLAKATGESSWTHNVLNNIITLPPLPGGLQATEENMRAGVDNKTATYQFSIEVGEGHNLRREAFEWRKVKEGKDKQLFPAPFTSGFKLVRLGSNHMCGEEEVFATLGFKKGLSLSEPFRLRFLSRLGERWEIMVIITALKLWMLKEEGRATGSWIKTQGDGWVTGTSG